MSGTILLKQAKQFRFVFWCRTLLRTKPHVVAKIAYYSGSHRSDSRKAIMWERLIILPMSDRTENSYLPPDFEPTREDPVPWRVAELRQLALRGVLVAASFAPFQLAFHLFGRWIGPLDSTT